MLIDFVLNSPWSALICLASLATALMVSTALGFVAGLMHARSSARRQLTALRAAPLKIFEEMLKSLDSAQELCGLMERIQSYSLQPEQVTRLATRQNTLLEALRRIIQRHAQQAVDDANAAVSAATNEPLTIEWLMTPADPVTHLPDRSAFDANLALLLHPEKGPRTQSGVLFVRIDRLNALRTRFGAAHMEQLLRKFGAVICRCVRDLDFVGQVNTELFGVLIPAVGFETGARQARVVRDAIRSYRFRLDDHGLEVLLTASFGFTICMPGEHSDLVLDRAADGLDQSQRLGRNQLHVHDGGRLFHSSTP